MTGPLESERRDVCVQQTSFQLAHKVECSTASNFHCSDYPLAVPTLYEKVIQSCWARKRKTPQGGIDSTDFRIERMSVLSTRKVKRLGRENAADILYALLTSSPILPHLRFSFFSRLRTPEMCRRFFFDTRLNLSRHRVRDLLAYVRDKPDRARHNTDTPYYLPR